MFHKPFSRHSDSSKAYSIPRSSSPFVNNRDRGKDRRPTWPSLNTSKCVVAAWNVDDHLRQHVPAVSAWIRTAHGWFIPSRDTPPDVIVERIPYEWSPKLTKCFLEQKDWEYVGGRGDGLKPVEARVYSSLFKKVSRLGWPCFGIPFMLTLISPLNTLYRVTCWPAFVPGSICNTHSNQLVNLQKIYLGDFMLILKRKFMADFFLTNLYKVCRKKMWRTKHTDCSLSSSIHRKAIPYTADWRL